MNSTVIIIALVVVALVAMIFIPQWRLKRAIPQVLRAFREANANSEKNAKTLDELGLKPRGMMEGMFRGRDYRQYAVQALMRAEIINMTEDGKMYLSEEKLYEAGIARGISYLR